MPVLIPFVGRSGSGKTTLLTKLIPLFNSMDLKVGTVKNTHHKVRFDQPGKDSFKHAEAGSNQVLLLSDNAFSLIGQKDPKQGLSDLVQKYFSDFDVVLSEGFKNEPMDKIEVFRSATGKTPLHIDPSYRVKALVSDKAAEVAIPFFALDDLEGIFGWLLKEYQIL